VQLEGKIKCFWPDELNLIILKSMASGKDYLLQDSLDLLQNLMAKIQFHT